MSTRTRSWRHRLAGALAITLAATLGWLAEAAPARADGTPCQEYVTIFRTNYGGTATGPGTATYNPGEFLMRTDVYGENYVGFGGVIRPRRSAFFKFINQAGAEIYRYQTSASKDNWVIHQEENWMPWDSLASPGRKLHIYADYPTRCGGDEVWVYNRYVGSVVTYPALPATVDPKYLVVGVIYTPPGSGSSVEYGNSTTLGARVSTSSSFQAGVTNKNSLTLGTSGSIGAETNFSQKTTDTFSVSVEKSASNAYVIRGPSNSNNGIDHNLDRFLLWLNPRFTITPTSPTEFVNSPFTNDPADPVSPNMDIVEVSVGQLKNPSTLPPGVASRLQRTWSPTGALNQNDFNDILATNPFANGNTAIDPNRFTLLPGSVFDFSPAPAGGQPTTQRYGVSFREAANLSISSTRTIGTKVSGPEETFTILTAKLKNQTTESFEFTSTTTLEASEAANQNVTLSLTGPTSDYQGPTALQVYEDTLTGTLAFAFAPVATYQIGTPTPAQTVTQGSAVTYPITTQSDFGYQNPVTFSGTVMGLPPGTSASFSPTSVTPGAGSTLTITTSTTTPPGVYPLTISANSGLIDRNLNLTLTVGALPFSITATPASQTVIGSGTAVYQVTVTPNGGFSGPVNLSGPTGLPPGATATYSPTTLANGGGTSTLTVTTSASTPAGTYTLNARVTGNGVTRTTPVTLVVDKTQDFGIAVTPQAAGIFAGETAEYTVTTSAINGFGGNVTLSISGHPNGTTPTFTVNPIAGAGTSTLRIPTSATTMPGDYDITITGTGGGKTHSETVLLSISAPPPDFTVTVAPNTQSAPAGGSASYPIATTAVSGFTGMVGLSVSGLPTGANATFVTSPLSPGTGATMAVAVNSATAPGTYPLTVTGTSGGLTHSKAATLTVTAAPPSDFMLSVDPTGMSVPRGNGGIALLSTHSPGGAFNPIDLTVSGVPAGVEVTLDATTVYSGSDVNVYLGVATSTAPGTYTITFTGTDGSSTQTDTLLLTVT